MFLKRFFPLRHYIKAYLYVCVCVWLWVGHGFACEYVSGNRNVCLFIYTGQPRNNIEVNQRTVKKERICHWKLGVGPMQEERCRGANLSKKRHREGSQTGQAVEQDTSQRRYKKLVCYETETDVLRKIETEKIWGRTRDRQTWR